MVMLWAPATSSALTPNVHEFLLPGGGGTVTATPAPSPTAVPPAGKAFNYGGYAVYSDDRLPRGARPSKAAAELKLLAGKAPGYVTVDEQRMRYIAEAKARQAALQVSVAPPERQAAWRTANRTIGTLDQSAMQRLGGASFKNSLLGAMPGKLLPSLARVLGPIGAAATAYQVCSSFLKAGCWLFENKPGAAPPVNASWSGPCTVRTDRSTCYNEYGNTVFLTGNSGPAQIPAPAGSKINVYYYNNSSYDPFYIEQNQNRASQSVESCYQFLTPSAGGAGYSWQHTDSTPCSGGALRRGIYWRMDGSTNGTQTASPPGSFDPAGVPVSGVDGFAPDGEEAAATAMADSALATSPKLEDSGRTANDIIAGAAVAAALPETTPMAEPAPGVETVTVPGYTGTQTWTEYQSSLADVGLKMQLEVLPDVAADVNSAPNAVLQTYPQPGSSVAKGSTIQVQANPATLTQPGLSFPSEDAPAPPGINMEPLKVPLGQKFPFGVPGWIAGRLGGMGGGSNCPVFTHGLPFDRQLKLDGCTFDGARDIYRPVLVVASFIGLGWMFFGAAFGFGGGRDD